ncbi:MAG: recombinase RecA [Planctomycetes bacterium]|nr:recombinase RecA [Planctomycetota bacterium]
MAQPQPSPEDRRKEALQQALAQIEKQFGKGSIMRLGDRSHMSVSGISTGSLSLDIALGGYGIPRGRVTEVFGPESSGKTTLCLTVAAKAQKAGGIAAYIDAEHALDPAYSRRLGVDLDNLLLSQPDSGEQALEITEHLVRSNAIDVIVIDSVAALVPRSELEGEMGDATVGGQARLMSQALRKLTAAIARSHCCVIFVNQIREKIGVMFGNPETTPGGRALKFYSSVRIDTRRVNQIKDGEAVVGNRTKATVVKNKIAPPFQKAEFDLLFNAGISWEGDLLDLGVEKGVVEKSGTWLSYKETRLGQGRDRAREFLRENGDVARALEIDVRRAFGLEPAPSAVAAAPGAQPPAPHTAEASGKAPLAADAPAPGPGHERKEPVRAAPAAALRK